MHKPSIFANVSFVFLGTLLTVSAVNDSALAIGGGGSVQANAPCGSVPHGTPEFRQRYHSNTVPSGGRCWAQRQSRTCNNGTFSKWNGTYAYAECRKERCGDGSVATNEQCDDANQVDGDGCDNNCTVTGCGNSIRTTGEQCDDGLYYDFDRIELSSSGILAYYEPLPENEGHGIIINWVDPPSGSYYLQLYAGTQTLFYGGHPTGSATVNYESFGLNGRERLTGSFSHYADDGTWLTNSPEFTIHLSIAGNCRFDCTWPFCGDGITDSDEECDEGAANSDTEAGACRADCTLPPALPTDATRFIGLNGQELVDRIVISEPQDVSPVYSVSGSDATQLFSEANMLAIAAEINQRAATYNDANAQSLESLIYFIRAAFYVQFYSPGDVPAYTTAVATSIKEALTTLFANNTTWSTSDASAGVLQEGLILVDSAQLGADFNYVTIKVLTDYDITWKESPALNAAANSVFSILFRSQWDERMKTLFATDDAILDALFNFQASHRDILGTDAEYVLYNAARELARLYHIEALRPRVKPMVKAMLDTSSKDDNTRPIWLAVAEMADYYDRADCGYYNICGFLFFLERETLSFNYKCSETLKIRAQNMYNAQAEWICQVLGQQEMYFHQLLNTNNIPVPDDLNASLELVIFDSAKDYETYAGMFFGIGTNNGGMYLEGAPNEQNNQARFIAYEADWMRPNFHVWNLQHEGVHYLDCRFNLYGDFGQSLSANTIWWIEGIGEYASYRDGYKRAVEIGKSKQFALSEIFKNTYNSGIDRIYRWGYLAVRFMFEKHGTDVTQILSMLRNNQYSEYQLFMDGIGTSYDNEWFAWLGSDLSTLDSGIVDFGPNDSDAASSGSNGNWEGEPVTISTDFSPCVANVPTQAHDPMKQQLSLDTPVECVTASGGRASFAFANTGQYAGTLTITTTGGWGNADILYKAGAWPSRTDNDAMASGAGNEDTLTVSINPNVTWHLITLDGDFGGVKLQLSEN
jgi:cysteine-rich repeat protein